MSFRVQPLVMTTLLSVTVLAGCAHLPNAVPGVSLGKQHNDRTRLNVARLFERQNRLGAARKLYAEMHTKDPQNLVVSHRMAVVSTRLGDFEQANSYYQESLALDPLNSDVLADLGYSLHLQGDIEGAEAALRKSLDLDPDNKRAIGNLALVVGMSGRIGESLLLYRRVVREAEAQANLGYIHVQRGEGDQAIERYDQALTLDEDLTSAANALVKLAELRNAKSSRNYVRTSSALLQVVEKPAQNDNQSAAQFATVIRGQTGLARFVQNSGKPGQPMIQSPHRVGQTATTDPESGLDPLTVPSDGRSATESPVGRADVQQIGVPVSGMSVLDFELPSVFELVPEKDGR